MVKGKHKNIRNRIKEYLASSEHSSLTTANPGYSNTPEKQDYGLKSHLMMMIKEFKEDINNSLKEIQENTVNQIEELKEETQKFLKELKEDTTKQVKELNKTIQDLKMEIETIKKAQRETNLEIENLGKRPGVINVSITNRIQEVEKRISGAEDTIENMDTTVKENEKCIKLLTQNIQEIKDTMRRPNPRIISIEESEESQLKGTVNIFNKIIEENFPSLKKEMPMNIQEAYRTLNRLDQKRNSSCHIISKTQNAQNKESILKAVRGKSQVIYKGRPIRITADVSPETMKARRS
jgi:chromosome segregation ATPase